MSVAESNRRVPPVEREEEGRVVLVEHLTVAPDHADAFAAAWAERVAQTSADAGLVSAQLRPAADPPGAFVSIVVWRSTQAGADPLRLEELGARLVQPARPPREATRSILLDPLAREVHRRGVPVRLTLKEFDLLQLLMSHPRRVFTRDELMDRVWGYRAAFETGTLTVHVRRLRSKLEDEPSRPRHLQTVWGVGYRFVP
jgi:quinol monooxygenase YgiN